ncbi:DUF262 domain-containing protein [Chryseobacterium shandongense]|uniref:DUF262 domain-containing protein n=1 Tax=Chryseobacterium shandongense TaxID=1493872 RepID=A0AAD1DM95_9FLAO|nr:DUF262 domain-containing protein [Chryseobacterium shandongense]AZA86840.1 DUF262 domain-containing protein [Chryseobacterium shandongense]AZA95256.1 DUF262 domain-containing protein [Chryseobacterium shandongense]
MTVSKNQFYSLENIANWQLKGDEKIKLPILQRSFVWKPNQIETVWDSILRGYPIGAFLLAETTDSTFELLDGQQRSTSISLGFFSPWEENSAKFFDNKNKDYGHIPTVWIDLNPEKVSNTNKYLIRVLTRSHPWGYQAKNNSSTLSVSDRKKALDIFKNAGRNVKYTELKNIDVFPFDANLPIPLVFLLKYIYGNQDASSSKEKLINQIAAIKMNNQKESLYEDFIASNAFDDFIDEISKNLTSYSIPAIVLNSSLIKVANSKEKEDPTLFVRLNSQGTPLNGEELIYSIYKAEFPKSKKLVESISADFIQPSRLLSFVNRLVWSDLNQNNYPNSFSVNQFRDRLNNLDFLKRLEDFIGSDSDSIANKVFKKSFDILLSENEIKLPIILVKSLINDYPEIFFFYLNWIYIHYYNIEPESFSEIKKGFFYLTLFTLDKNKLPKEIWGESSKLYFWTFQNLKKLTYSNYLFITMPKISDLQVVYKMVIEKKVRWNEFYPSKEEYLKLFDNALEEKGFDEGEKSEIYKNQWNHLANQLAWNRNVLIYCQRDYFNKNFQEFNSLEVLSDTNRPWDYDHIYPSSWVYQQQNVNPQIRDWHNMNANLRAISLEENRSDGNREDPKLKAESLKASDFFIIDDKEYWTKIENRIYDEQSAMYLMSAFVTRTINFYKEIYFFIVEKSL